ncbi:hypothetical protein [Streptomyces sp. NPDC047071]|uniref:hypothetical protein n=1 Tax=Streptomyces sp. NPDC047071 TaxID=3154808 RepID=UPI003451D8BD
MGIESDQLVFDYLSRVGDLAQQRQLSSAARMRLVSELRGEIDRRRAKAADSPAAVRRILDRIGSPDELVTAAADTTGAPAASPPPAASAPSSPAPSRSREPRRPRRVVPRPRRAAGAAAPAGPASPPAPEPRRPAPPHLAGTDELGDSAPDLEPDWWRVERVPEEGAHTVYGFVGGVEIPEMLRRPPTDLEKKGTGAERGEDGAEEADEAEDSEAAEDAEDAEEEAAPDEARRRRFGILPLLTKDAPPARRTPLTKGGPAAKGPAAKGSAAKGPAARGPAAKESPGEEAPGAEESVPDGSAGAGVLAGVRSLSNPVLLLAAAALVVGAVIGNWFALGGGWIVAWFSRKLSPAEKKAAVIAVPALTIAGGIAWLWGRSQGKWGEPIAKGQMNAAVEEAWPWVVRAAAVASALFLVWRSQRSKPE